MPDHTVHVLDRLTPRLRAAQQRVARLEALRDRAQADLAAREQEVVDLGVRVLTLTKVGEVLKLLLDQLVLTQVRTIEGLITEGLQAIFPDQGLSLEAEAVPRYGKMAIDLYFRQGKDGEVVVRDEPLEAFGGGPAVVASLMLRAVVLMRLKKYPLLLLDESLIAISDGYVPNTGMFLRTLCKSAGLDLLLVTHNPDMLVHANRVYQATSTPGASPPSLTLKETR